MSFDDKIDFIQLIGTAIRTHKLPLSKRNSHDYFKLVRSLLEGKIDASKFVKIAIFKSSFNDDDL